METPEGARLQLAVAGPVVRALAWLIDVTLRGLVLVAIYIVFGQSLYVEDSAAVTIGLLLIVQFILSWLYTTLFEAITGTTPGKRFYRLWVVHDNATPLTGPGAVIRNLLRAIDGLPFFNAVGLITMLVDNRFRRLGDLAAGTLVVYRERETHHATFEHSHGRPPPTGLSREDRQAVVDFAERGQELSPDRQRELAQRLQHWMAPDDEPVDTVKAWAHWILRGQQRAESAEL